MDVDALTEHTVADAARAAGIEAPTSFLAVTGSTNSDLMRLGTEGAPEWTVAVAAEQTSGRGRLGRTWLAPPGTSLLVSVLLRPELSPAEAPLLSLAAAVAMAEAVEVACEVDAGCKWPNDLLAGHRKLGGILPESSIRDGVLEHAVIGAGVNLLQAPGDFPLEIRDSATSVRIEGGRADPVPLLTAYLTRLRRRAAEPSALGDYRSRCVTLGRQVEATTRSGSRVRGTAVDVGRAGELLVETAEGIERVAFGEVVHLG